MTDFKVWVGREWGVLSIRQDLSRSVLTLRKKRVPYIPPRDAVACHMSAIYEPVYGTWAAAMPTPDGS